MSAFAPAYSSQLQAALDHAERFAAFLLDREIHHPPPNETGRAWLTGRSEEVEMVTGFILTDWRAGKVTDAGAFAAVSSYVRAMHIGARRHLRLDRTLECCGREGVAMTTLLAPHDQGPATQRLYPSTQSSSGAMGLVPERCAGDAVTDLATPYPDDPATDAHSNPER